MKRFYALGLDNDYFLVTLKIGYSNIYLRSTEDFIEMASITFTSVCERYCSNSRFFLGASVVWGGIFYWLCFSSVCSLQPALSTQPRWYLTQIEHWRYNYVCKSYWNSTNEGQSFWLTLVTHTGCREGFLMADGIEKVGLVKKISLIQQFLYILCSLCYISFW